MRDPLSPIYIFLLFFSLQVISPYLNVLFFHQSDSTYLSAYKTDFVSLNRAFLCCLIYVFFWFIGYAFSKRPITFPTVHPIGMKFKRKDFIIIITLVVISLTFLISLSSMAQSGPRSDLAKGSNGKILYLSIVLLITAYWVAYIELRSNIFKFHALNAKTLLIFLLLIIVSISLSSLGGRGRAIFVLLGVFFVTHYNHKSLSLKKMSLIFLTVLGAGTYLSVIKLDLTLSELALVREFLFGHFGGRNFDGIFNIAAVITKIEFPVSYGTAMLSGAITDIVNTPMLTSRQILMAEVFGVTGELKFGVNPTKIGEILINFGYAGIPIFAFGYGFLSKQIYLIFIKKRILGDYSPIIYFLICYYHGSAHIDQYISEKIVYLFLIILSLLTYLVAFRGYWRVKLGS